MSRSQQFEVRISYIHRLLEEDGCVVTWNDRIPDPDNPDRSRQVDVLIKRGDQIVHVECRSHKSPQDVKWIEELIGRRISLAADQVIAASDSGFTEGARRKALTHGIVLRDLQMVTDAEVASWGKRTVIEFSYYKLSNVLFHLEFEGVRPQHDIIGNYLVNQPGLVSSIVNGAKYAINSIGEKTFPLCIQADMEPSLPVFVDGSRVTNVLVRYEADEFRVRHSVPTVFTYGEPVSNKPAQAIVETLEAMELEIIKSKGQCFVHIDLSTIPPPGADEIFAGVVHLENVWNLSVDKMHLIGEQELPTILSTFGLWVPIEGS